MKTKLTNQIKFILSLLMFFSMTDSLLSQVSRQWMTSYNGAGNTTDNAFALTVDASGNVYVTGWSMGAAYHYATVKYNPSGVQQWAQLYDSSGGNARASSIAVDASGNVYVTGTSYVNATGYDYLTVKYNSSGVVQWTRRYDGGVSGMDNATAIKVDAAGNVYITGSATEATSLGDFVTIKYNSSGVQQWVKAFTGGTPGNDFPSSIAVDASGNVYVTGKCLESTTGYDYLTVKYNSSGVLQWFKKYAAYNANDDGANAITVDSLGNVYVTGSSKMGTLASTTDYATIKYSSSGTQLWAVRYNGPAAGEDDAYSIAVDGSGSVFVTGASAGSGSSFDMTTIKYNSSGVMQWVNRENGPGNGGDRGSSLALDAAGNVYVTGPSVGNGSAEDYLTIKYNSGGVTQWSQRENGAFNGADVAMALKLDNSGNVYVTGYSAGSTGPDFMTVKYNQLTGITPVSNEMPSSYKLSQNYPNPFNPVTSIKFSVPAAEFVTLKVYDVAGKEAAVLVNQNLNAGVYDVDFDASQLSSGAYFYRLSTVKFTDVKKMILIK